MTRPLFLSGLATAAIIACAAAPTAQAQTQTYIFNIPAQELGSALRSFAQKTRVQLIFDGEAMRGKRSRPLKGQYSAGEGIAILLQGTGLIVHQNAEGVFVISRSSAENTPTNAPSESSDSIFVTDEIVVTAQKRTERLLDVPASITAETGTQLLRRGATQLQDIVATTPGLSNPGPGGGNGSNLVIRGVTTDTAQALKQSTVSVMFDDIPVDPSTAGLEATNLRIVDIERVEVLRGPQGTLFGSGSLSGAVRYITNKPDATRISGSIEGNVASTKSGADSQWGNVVLNLPLVTDRVAVRAVGYGFNEGGWVDNIHFDQKNVNRNKTYGGRIALMAQATDNLTLTLTGAYQDSHDYAGGESLYFQPAGTRKQISTSQNSGDSRVQSTLANLGLTYDFGEISLFSSSTYIRRKVDFLQDFGFYTDLMQLQFGLPPLDNTTPGRTYNASNIYTQELRLASNGSGPFRWTFGGFYLRSRTPHGGQTITAPGLMPYLGTDNLVNVSSVGGQEEIAGFGQATYTIADTLDLTAGLRVSNTKLDITSISSGLLVTGGTDDITFRLPARETTYNPRFSVLYRLTDQVSVYAQAARGYRVGGANLTAGLGGPGIPRTYKSDNLWNYEAGVKTSLLNGRLQINADVYYIDWKKLQVSLEANNFNYTGNAGAARVYGFEAEVTAKPTSWLDLGGSLSLSNAALTQDTPTLVRTTGVVGVEDGDRLPASPRTQGSAYAQLNFKVNGDTAYVRASGHYVGASYTDFDAQGIRYGDYGAVDLRAGIAHENVELAIFARNLLDGDGKRSAAPESTLGPIIATEQMAWRIRPRTIGLTGRISF